ncbi:MAG: (Fe-S)-binding protein [Anaerolineales bacterium]
MTHQVQFFITCLVDTLFPEIGLDAIEVLKRFNVEVACPSGQTCCGQPAFNAGLRQEAKKIAKHTIEVFEPTEGDIVIPSGSCCSMIRNHYGELFADEPAWQLRAEKFANRCYEFSEYLVDVLKIQEVPISYPAKITYHPSCHLLRELGIANQPLFLLQQIKEAELVPLPHAEECCGFGGVFSVEHPRLSNAFLERKLTNIAQSGADIVVTCDAGCMMNINGGLAHRHQPIKAVHLAQILNQKLSKSPNSEQ